MKKKYKAICIIPARSGSKRIKNKNIKSFFGKPIIAWAIKTAIKSKCFDKIIVSTDDKKIAKIAKKYSAETPFLRPKNLSTDYASILSVVKHSIKEMIKINYKPNIVCCLLATTPLLNYKDLQRGVRLLKNKKKKRFVFTIKSYPYPIQRALKINKKKHISMINSKEWYKRSQDLPETYHDAGQFYLGRAESFLTYNKIFTKNSMPIILKRFSTIDIDNLDDWKEAELFFRLRKLKKNLKNIK